MNIPCIIDAPFENYTKIPGISKKEQNHLIHSVLCLINRALRISSCIMPSLSKDRVTMEIQ